jgi:signal transduction histidine kinase
MNEESRHRTHVIVSALIRALNHRIRTPLSVISNELEAVRAIAPAQETDAARQRVQQISDILKSAAQFAVSPAPQQRIDAVQILSEVATQNPECVMRPGPASVHTLGDKKMMALAIASIVELLSQFTKNSSPQAVHVEIHQPKDGFALMEFEAPFQSFLSGQDESEKATLTDFFNNALDLDSLLPPCIDSILLSQNVTLAVSAARNVRIVLQFAVCE